MKKRYFILMLLLLIFSMDKVVYAMHIGEGFLPIKWSLFYFVISLPFIILGLKDIKKKTERNKDLKMLLGVVAAYVFVLSAMKLPSITGSSSHPTGTGLGAIIFGPKVMVVISMLVLLFQAILLAHGGLTTLGANTFSMGIVGPAVAFVVYKLLKSKNKKVAIFTASALGNLATYFATSVQLAFSFPATDGGVTAAFIKFISIFSITQLPLAVIEGIVTVIIFDFIYKHSNEELKALGWEE